MKSPKKKATKLRNWRVSMKRARAYGLGTVAAPDRKAGRGRGCQSVRPERGSAQAAVDLGARMTTRTHFTFRIDRLDTNGEVFEHVAGVEDFELAVAT